MASRDFVQFQGTLEKGVVNLWAPIQFAGAGTPVLVNWNPNSKTYAAVGAAGGRGIKSIARTGVGVYTLTLQDTYQRLLTADVTFISNTNPVAPTMAISVATNPNAANALTANGFGATNNLVTLLFFSAAGVAADPAATELGVVQVQLQNSQAL